MSAFQFYLLTGLYSVSALLLLVPRGSGARYAGFMILLSACALLGYFLHSIVMAGAALLIAIALSVGWVRDRRLRRGSPTSAGSRIRRSGRAAMFRRVNAGLLASATFGILLSAIWTNPHWRVNDIPNKTPELRGGGTYLLVVIVLILTLLFARGRGGRKEDTA